MADSKNISVYFGKKASQLNLILKKVKELQAIEVQFLKHLSENLRPYCQLANVTQQRLVVIVANGSAASYLRWQQHDLLKALKQEALFEHIQVLQIKVRSIETLATPVRKTMPALTSTTAAIIHHGANSLGDPELKAVMQRIASRQSKS